jgi:hemoglobin
MKDLQNRQDIEQVLEMFYNQVLKDYLIGHFFTSVVKLDLQKHIPIISDFWEAVIFNTQGYRKNVMEVHQHIHLLQKIEKVHLDRWVQIFTQTIDSQFEGEKASLMKHRASSIATLMDIKLNHPLINKPS